jgi:hypothetical protein
VSAAALYLAVIFLLLLLLLLLACCRLTSSSTEIVCDSWTLRKQLLAMVTQQLHIIS